MCLIRVIRGGKVSGEWGGWSEVIKYKVLWVNVNCRFEKYLSEFIGWLC